MVMIRTTKTADNTQVWSGRSWPAQPDNVFEIMLKHGVPDFGSPLKDYDGSSWVVSVHFYNADPDMFEVTAIPVSVFEAQRVWESLKVRKPHTKRNNGGLLSVYRDSTFEFVAPFHYLAGVAVEPPLGSPAPILKWGDAADLPPVNVDRTIYDSVILGL